MLVEHLLNESSTDEYIAALDKENKTDIDYWLSPNKKDRIANFMKKGKKVLVKIVNKKTDLYKADPPGYKMLAFWEFSPNHIEVVWLPK